VKSLCSLVLMVMLFGTICPTAAAQENVSDTKTDRDDLDKFDLVWPEEPAEEPATDTEPPQGRPMLHLDIEDVTGPRTDDQAAAGTDRSPAASGSRSELTTLIGELREEVAELRHEVRRLRTTIELLSARISGSRVAQASPDTAELVTGAGQGGFHPFWLPQQ